MAPTGPSHQLPTMPVADPAAAATTAAVAPSLTPTRSGVASRLPARVWVRQPATPRAAPTSRPVKTRGSRKSRTIMTVPASPVPSSPERVSDRLMPVELAITARVMSRASSGRSRAAVSALRLGRSQDSVPVRTTTLSGGVTSVMPGPPRWTAGRSGRSTREGGRRRRRAAR